jgi:coenzyme F420-0:L-glutamate ligase/coenzyme F420-1:gamma-L-glutamate ligase
MQVPEYRVFGIPGLPEIGQGSGLGELICRAVRAASLEVLDGDILVVTQKVVSKDEGRTVRLESVEPSPLARTWGQELGKDPALVEIILSQSRRIVRMDRGRLIVETHHGFVCANAGVDQSNTASGEVTLLPEDSDASARRLRNCLERSFQARLAVIVSDTFGRPWREGLVNVAIGTAGLAPLMDYRGELDSSGRRMEATAMAWADELAGAAEPVMGKTDGIPVAIVRGLTYQQAEGSACSLIREPENDLFR